MPPKRKLEESSISIDDTGTGKKRKIDNNNNKITIKEHDWNSAFPTVFDIHEQYQLTILASPKTALEKSIMRYSRMIRAQPNWHIDIKNQEWVREIKLKLTVKCADDSVIQYIFDELEQHYANLIDGAISPTPVDGVYQADNIIPDQLKQAFVNGFNKVEIFGSGVNFKVAAGIRELFGSENDRNTVDVVCPSLCCFSRKDSKRQEAPVRLDQIVQKDAVFIAPLYMHKTIWEPYKTLTVVNLQGDSGYSTDQPQPKFLNESYYQWLPSDFNIDNNGKVTIESYINNLHPVEYSNVHDSIAQIFEQFIPLFNKTLTDVLNPLPNRIQYDQIHEDLMALNESQRSLTNEISPNVPEFRPNKATSQTVVDLKGRRVQVIVRMVRVDLGSQQDYTSPWLVDGMPHERIIATGVYCAHSGYISPMHISFREPIVPPFSVARDTEVFGLEIGAPLIQQRGAVSMQSDRCLVYPNLWQHQISFGSSPDGFRGSMSLLYFYLVDPATPILSTKHVLPQQPSWLIDHRSITEGTALSLLPSELLRIIFSEYSYGFTYPEASSHRQLAIDERKSFNKHLTKKWMRRTYGSESDL